jgi:hypothetical protein
MVLSYVEASGRRILIAIGRKVRTTESWWVLTTHWCLPKFLCGSNCCRFQLRLISRDARIVHAISNRSTQTKPDFGTIDRMQGSSGVTLLIKADIPRIGLLRSPQNRSKNVQRGVETVIGYIEIPWPSNFQGWKSILMDCGFKYRYALHDVCHFCHWRSKGRSDSKYHYYINGLIHIVCSIYTIGRYKVRQWGGKSSRCMHVPSLLNLFRCYQK